MKLNHYLKVIIYSNVLGFQNNYTKIRDVADLSF